MCRHTRRVSAWQSWSSSPWKLTQWLWRPTSHTIYSKMWETNNIQVPFRQVNQEDSFKSPLCNNTAGGLSQQQLPWPFLKHWVHPVSNGPLPTKYKRHSRPFVSLPLPCPLKQAQPFHSLPLKGSFPLASTQPSLSFPFEGFLWSPPPPLLVTVPFRPLLIPLWIRLR